LNILVFNCGSSSLNYKVFSAAAGKEDLEVLAAGKAHRVGVKGTQASFIEYHSPVSRKHLDIAIPNHKTAGELVLNHLKEEQVLVDAIGHRFVHGGSYFQTSTFLTEENSPKLMECMPLAPIHNPNSMSVIKVCKQQLPHIPQYLTFDTAFHAGLSPEAYTYALPQDLLSKYGWRKYGFHGLSYQYVCQTASRFLHRSLESTRIVACHLGTGGSSAVAVAGGKSIDTTMGFSPLAGLMMSTRSGDLDPLLPGFLVQKNGFKPTELEMVLNKKSGLLGIAGFSSDIRDIIQRWQENGDQRAQLAFDIYTQRLRKTIGAFIALLGGLDVLIFTDDIGLQNARVRSSACTGLEWAGIHLDENRNQKIGLDHINRVEVDDSAATILVMPTDEELVIGMEGLRLLKEAKNAHY
jgi:acetate kinase